MGVIRDTVVVAGAVSFSLGVAAPAQADYYAYIDQLVANGLLVYGRPPRCIPQGQTDPICPHGINTIWSDEEAYRVGNNICTTIQRGGTRAEAIEGLTYIQGITYSESAASAIYDIAVTTLCWQ